MSLSITVSDPLHLAKADISRTFSQQLTSQVAGYGHELRAIGGFYSASIIINEDQNGIEDWLQNGLSRHIVVHNPALEVIWEGFVNQISATLGTLEFSIGPLLDVGNRIRVAYSTIDTSSNPPTLGIRKFTDWVDGAASQAAYGIIEKAWGINGATDAQALELRDSFINDPTRTFPSTSRESRLSSSGEPSVRIECLGYWHWLTTYHYSNSAAGTANRSQIIQDALAADPNGIISTDYSGILSNTEQMQDGFDGTTTAESIIKKINAYGHTNADPTLVGIYAGQKFFYQKMPTEIEYHQRIAANIGIADRLDGPVSPWDVKAGKWIFYPDFLVGRELPAVDPFTATSFRPLGEDPRAGFIEVVKYTAPNDLNISAIKLSTLDQLLARQGMAGIA